MVPPLGFLQRLRHSGDPLCHQAADAIEMAQRQMMHAIVEQVRAEEALKAQTATVAELVAEARQWCADYRHHECNERLALIEAALALSTP